VPPTSQKLAKLLFDGTQLVTNIQVATDAMEMQRRAEETKLKLERVERLENEAKSSTKKMEEITSKWALAKEMTIPQELWQLLSEQQQQCTLLLNQKNKLIDDLQEELKNKDEQYMEAIKKQSDDIFLLLERMEEQIRNMLTSYHQKLLRIEKAFELEQQELLDSHRKKWEEAIQVHNAKELENLHDRLRKVEEFEVQLKQLQVQDEEEYNSMKLQLENDVQNLEKQIEHMKAVYRLNQEKLDHNLKVLKRRDEENTILRSQQKRKLKRLHTVFSNLRTKLANQEKQFSEENQSLTAYCERITNQCKEIQRRMRAFAVSDAEKFTEIWLMNEEEAKGLMRKALDADRIIHTQQLGLPWEEPHYWFLDNVGPLGSYKTKEMVTKLVADVLTAASGEGKKPTPKAEDRASPLQNIPKKTAKRILELVSHELDFLIERKLLRFLSTLGRYERTLMKLTYIFEALKIDSEDDLCQLLDFFLKYKAQEMAASQVGPTGTAVGKASVQEKGTRINQGSPGGEDISDLDSISHTRKDELKYPLSTQRSLPSVPIHADDVLKILRAFVQDFNKLREKDVAVLQKEVLQVRDSSKDGEYWEALTHIIPEPTLKLWDALELALKEY
ncbi:DRC1 protein, partial [Centropus unirufus]|nr:DRC1 protein [Centropus unirufus]